MTSTAPSTSTSVESESEVSLRSAAKRLRGAEQLADPPAQPGGRRRVKTRRPGADGRAARKAGPATRLSLKVSRESAPTAEIPVVPTGFHTPRLTSGNSSLRVGMCGHLSEPRSSLGTPQATRRGESLASRFSPRAAANPCRRAGPSAPRHRDRVPRDERGTDRHSQPSLAAAIRNPDPRRSGQVASSTAPSCIDRSPSDSSFRHRPRPWLRLMAVPRLSRRPLSSRPGPEFRCGPEPRQRHPSQGTRQA